MYEPDMMMSGWAILLWLPVVVALCATPFLARRAATVAVVALRRLLWLPGAIAHARTPIER